MKGKIMTTTTVPTVSATGGVFLLCASYDESKGRGGSPAFHTMASAARSLARAGLVRAVRLSFFQLTDEGRAWVAAYREAEARVSEYADAVTTGARDTEWGIAEVRAVAALRRVYVISRPAARRAIADTVSSGRSLASAVADQLARPTKKK